jgi:hypothetical protein
METNVLNPKYDPKFKTMRCTLQGLTARMFLKVHYRRRSSASGKLAWWCNKHGGAQSVSVHKEVQNTNGTVKFEYVNTGTLCHHLL